MKPFEPIMSPELPTYEEFAESIKSPGKTIDVLLDDAQTMLSGARRRCDALAQLGEKEAFSVGVHERWTNDRRKYIKTLIAAGLAVAAVQKALSAAVAKGKLNTSDEVDGETLGLVVEIPKAEESYHAWWIVPKISEKPGV
jgi:hypothetical protein